jgi:hypothetical protein
MYDGVYAEMVRAGVAVETAEERMYNEFGERVFDEYLMYCRPTKYMLVKT